MPPAVTYPSGRCRPQRPHPSEGFEAFILWLEDTGYIYGTLRQKNKIHRLGQINADQRLYTACGVQIVDSLHIDSYWDDDEQVGTPVENLFYFCKKCKASPKRLVLGQQLAI